MGVIVAVVTVVVIAAAVVLSGGAALAVLAIGGAPLLADSLMVYAEGDIDGGATRPKTFVWGHQRSNSSTLAR